MDRQSAVADLSAAVAAFAKEYLATADHWCVALSGGPDSLALTAVAAGLLPTTALIVDHGLQGGSAAIAATAKSQAEELGCVDAQVLCVQVSGDGGPEAAARNARYHVLEAARRDRPVLLAHTLDDQAETVLLGLGRGSGARSIAGMRRYDPPWCRPLLGMRRGVTHAACAELGLAAWHDPHNTDRRFTRTRLRHEVLPLMEEVLGGGVAEALARTATALREDTELVDALIAQAMMTSATAEGLDTRALAALPDPVRRGVIRSWLLAGGAIGLTDKQIRGVNRLITAWRGQGGVAVGSALRNQRLVAGRSGGLLTLRREPISPATMQWGHPQPRSGEGDVQREDEEPGPQT
jgi:tRNA(Ile)-lysidine synthase